MFSIWHCAQPFASLWVILSPLHLSAEVHICTQRQRGWESNQTEQGPRRLGVRLATGLPLFCLGAPLSTTALGWSSGGKDKVGDGAGLLTPCVSWPLPSQSCVSAYLILELIQLSMLYIIYISYISKVMAGINTQQAILSSRFWLCKSALKNTIRLPYQYSILLPQTEGKKPIL